uniref:Uncharacterized protein n=1 Tax=Arundo donax TaxID=35708 RepID=A0A0A8Y7U1_ARUDO
MPCSDANVSNLASLSMKLLNQLLIDLY